MDRLHFDLLNQAPVRESVRAAIQNALGQIGNPACLYSQGRAASRWVERSRSQVAAFLHCRSEEVFFTSSGTEANTWVLKGLAGAAASKGRHLVVSAVEHLSVLQTVRRMEKEGWFVTVVPVDRWGRVDPEAVEAALNPSTVLVSIQWASAEVGTIQPIADLARRVKAKEILFHSDAIAAAGQIPVDFSVIAADALSVAGNVWGAPPGTGALILRKGVRIQPLFVGGTQEQGRRAGTENLLGIVGMGEAAAAAAYEGSASSTVVSLRDRLWRGILEVSSEASLNGHSTERLPGHLNVSFPGVDGEALVLSLDLRGVAVGLGSACTFQTRKPSHVLKAIGLEDRRALGAIVFSFGSEMTVPGVDRVVEILPQALGRRPLETTV